MLARPESKFKMIKQQTLILISGCRKPFSARPAMFWFACLWFSVGLMPGADRYLISQTVQANTLLARQPQEATEIKELELRKPIERDLSGSQSHFYKFTLSSNQYVHILVEQKGIDVEVTLAGPDGKPLMTIDGSSGLRDSEPVHWVSEVPGNDRFEVSHQGGTGQYQVELRELRAATDQSRVQVAAAQASAEGDRLFNENTKASLEASIKKYEEALTMYRTLEVRDREATMLYNIGFVCRAMGDMKKALSYYTEALRLRQAGTNRGEEATTLHDIGSVYYSFGDLQTALEYFSKALPLRIEVGDKNGEAITRVATAPGLS